MPIIVEKSLADPSNPYASDVIVTSRHVHHFVPKRTERLHQDGRMVEITTDVYCAECGDALHLELGT